MLLKALGVVFAAIPFAFAAIRAIQTGSDVRYVWVALSAMFGGVIVAARARGSQRGLAVPAVFILVFLISFVLAVAAALLLGTRFGPGLLIVAAGFAGCFAASSALSVLARHRRGQLIGRRPES